MGPQRLEVREGEEVGRMRGLYPVWTAVPHYGIHFRGVLHAGTGELGQVPVRHWDGLVLSVCTSLR